MSCTLEGYACEYTNTFGFLKIQDGNVTERHPIFENIHGMMNVAREPGSYIDLEADKTIDIEYEFVGEIQNVKPYLSNERGEVIQQATGDYKGPFVLRVPEVLNEAEDEFLWTLEGVPLEDAYGSITEESEPIWYLRKPKEDKVMLRHQTIGGDLPLSTK